MVAPPGGRAFKEVKAGITMGTMEIPAATSLNGGRVAILKMHIPYAHFCMGIRTIVARARAPAARARRR
eukprot:COSAG03_NODE_23606_length_278_cov_1.446927_2_plen_68_part_01